MVVHAVDREQKTYPGDRKLKALCGRQPGGGTTRMGSKRSRWRRVGTCPTDSPVVNCEKCLKKMKELGVTEEDLKE